MATQECGKMSKPYTRSLRRRFAAALIDLFLILAFAWILSLPFAGPLSSSVRGGLGVYNETRCEKMPVYKPDGTQLLLDNWSKSVVCESKIENFFVSRFLLLQQKTVLARYDQLELGTYIETSVELDDRNFVAKTINATDIFAICIALFFGAMESATGKTPGKWLFSLRVLSQSGTSPNLAQGISRNIIKYFGLFVVVLIWFVSNFFDGHWILLIAGTGNVVNADNVPSGLMMGSLLFLFMLLLAIQCSIFLPWNKAGRALYDRLAGTIVIKEPLP